MKKLTASLQDHGVIRIAVPDASRHESYLRSANWKARKDSFHPLEHINGFTHQSLQRLGEDCGLHVVSPPIFPSVIRNPIAFIKQCIGNIYYRKRGTKIYFRKSTHAKD